MADADNKVLAIRGMIWTAIAQSVSIGVVFVVTPVVIRNLGAAEYGIWSIVMALTGYYGLVNMGLGVANTKFVAQFDALGDMQSVQEVMSTCMAMLSVLALVILGIAVGVAWAFPWVFDIGDYPISIARWIVILTGLKVGAELVGQVFVSGLMARKCFDLRNILFSTQRLLIGILTILAVKLGYGLLGMAIVLLGSTVAVRIVGWFLAVHVVGLPSPSPKSFRPETARMVGGFGTLSLVIQVVRRTSLVGGSVILGILAGPVAVAYYSVAESLTRRCLNLGKIFQSVMVPFASQFDAEDDHHALRRLLVLPTRLVLFLALLLAAILLVMGRQFLTLWISQDVATHVYPVICVLCLALLAKMPANIIHGYLVGMGRMGFLSRVALGEGIVIMLLGVVLVAKWGALGMASAVLVSQVLFSGFLMPSFACKEIGYPLHRFVLSSAAPAIGSVIPGIMVAMLLVQYVPANHLYVLVLQMGLVASLAAGVAFFVCLDSAVRLAAARALIPESFSMIHSRAPRPSNRR